MADMESGRDTAPDTVADDGVPVEDPGTTDGVAGAEGGSEAFAGGVMVGLTVLAALFFRWRSGPTFIDHWGTSLIHPDLFNSTWKHVTSLHSTSLVVASSILSALVVVARDRWRALACLVAPTLAIVLTEYLLKPVIARRYEQVLTFPSGTTTVVAAMATAWAVAVPRWIRPVIVVLGTFLVGLTCMAVIALQWHLPSDAIGGVVFGAGMVLLVDGLIHLAVGADRSSRESTPDTAADAAPSS